MQSKVTKDFDELQVIKRAERFENDFVEINESLTGRSYGAL